MVCELTISKRQMATPPSQAMAPTQHVSWDFGQSPGGHFRVISHSPFRWHLLWPFSEFSFKGSGFSPMNHRQKMLRLATVRQAGSVAPSNPVAPVSEGTAFSWSVHPLPSPLFSPLPSLPSSWEKPSQAAWSILETLSAEPKKRAGVLPPAVPLR